jgi:surface polysaccharide O-acyltransferase-like enzyme
LSEKRIEWIENLRASATLGVICLHITIAAFSQNPDPLSFNWWFDNSIETVSRCCVPVFLMISGALLFTGEYSLSTFLKNRVVRIIPPLLFWSFIYLAANLLFRYYSSQTISLTETRSLLLTGITQGVSFHFWYVYLIIGLYLFIPVIGKWSYHATDKELIYFLLIWMCTIVISPSQLAPYRPIIDLSNFAGYTGFLVMGYYLAQREDQKIKPLYFWLLAISGFLITALGTFYLYDERNGLSQLFYAYLTPNVVVLSAGVFALSRKITINNAILIKVRTLLCEYSFGIYLIHMLILSLLYKLGLNSILRYPVIGIPLLTVLCGSLSLVVTAIIRKIPRIGKYISG